MIQSVLFLLSTVKNTRNVLDFGPGSSRFSIQLFLINPAISSSGKILFTAKSNKISNVSVLSVLCHCQLGNMKSIGVVKNPTPTTPKIFWVTWSNLRTVGQLNRSEKHQAALQQ